MQRVRDGIEDRLTSSAFALDFEREPGCGFYHNTAHDLLVWVNGSSVKPEDASHLRIFATSRGLNLSEALARVASASILLESELDCAYDDHLGFITSCPSRLGTAMKIEIQMKVPYVLDDSHHDIAKKYGVTFTELEAAQSPDHMIVVTNSTTIGRSEVDLCRDVHAAAREYLILEKVLQAERAEAAHKAMLAASMAMNLAKSEEAAVDDDQESDNEDNDDKMIEEEQ